jgi:ferredoxin-thioredoxin reductase catalytic subunit
VGHSPDSNDESTEAENPPTVRNRYQGTNGEDTAVWKSDDAVVRYSHESRVKVVNKQKTKVLINGATAGRVGLCPVRASSDNGHRNITIMATVVPKRSPIHGESTCYCGHCLAY